tara:strand:- start:2102 stop:2452 length:351 start_codon:yes stop_codon:yes gene_type:complete
VDKKGVEKKEESVPVAPSTSFEMLKPPNNGSSVVHNPDVNQDADQDADQDVDPDVNGNKILNGRTPKPPIDLFVEVRDIVMEDMRKGVFARFMASDEGRKRLALLSILDSGGGNRR